MRNFITLILLFFLPWTLIAQEQETIQSKVQAKKAKKESVEGELKAKKVDHGFFYTFTNHYTKLDKRSVMTIGNRFGYYLNHVVMIGAGGHLFVTDLRYDDFIENEEDEFEDAYLQGAYVGFYVEPVLFSEKVVHVTFPVLIGMGYMAYSNRGFWNDTDFGEFKDYYEGWEKVDSDTYFVIEPAVNIEINITKFMRIGVEGKYRYANGLDLENTKSNILNNGAIGMNLKFGKF